MFKYLKKALKSFAFFFWKTMFFKKKQQYIFIMAHPRSGSSLLMQLLTNNKEVIGFGEYFTKYKTNLSLEKFEFDIRRKTNSLLRNKKYVANQINDNSITQNFHLANYKNIKYIFLIRKPQESLSSLLQLSEKKLGHSNPAEALKIYTERLHYFLKETPKIPSENRFFLTYEQLTKNTENTLKELSLFLDLKSPLTSKYQIEKYTQIWGDPSENIKKGDIITTNSVQIKLDEEILFKAEKEYDKIMALLFKEYEN